MTGLHFSEKINDIDDDLIFEAEHWVRPKARNIKIIVGAFVSAACLCLVIGITSGLFKGRNSLPVDSGPASGALSGMTSASADDSRTINGCPTLPGADEIYPAVQVDGRVYEWRFGKAIVDSMPVGSVYCGKLNHMVGRKTTQYDCDFVAVFSASGHIFYNESENLVYVVITTEWMENKIVIFEPSGSRYDGE